MVKIVTTKNKTMYSIDLTEKTWMKIAEGEHDRGDYPLRTNKGEFISVDPIEIGFPLTLYCPPITIGSTVRLITTSPIIDILDFER